MSRFRFAVLPLALALFAAMGYAETWNHATIVDVACAAKVKANPAAHPVGCALQCSAHGLGVYTADGTFLKLDARGTKEAVAILRDSKKKADVQVTVSGERHGDTIRVASIKAL